MRSPRFVLPVFVAHRPRGSWRRRRRRRPRRRRSAEPTQPKKQSGKTSKPRANDTAQQAIQGQVCRSRSARLRHQVFCHSGFSRLWSHISCHAQLIGCCGEHEKTRQQSDDYCCTYQRMGFLAAPRGRSQPTKEAQHLSGAAFPGVLGGYPLRFSKREKVPEACTPGSRDTQPAPQKP